MIHNLLSGSLIGGLYLALLFALCACACVFVKLCIYYRNNLPKKQTPPCEKAEAPAEAKPEAKKKSAARRPVNKLVVDPNAVNRIYIKSK